MILRLLLAAICLITLLSAHSAIANEPRILSGAEAEVAHFRSAVALVEKDQPFAYRGHFCGGVLIRPRWVLTAAHCSPGALWRNTDVVIGRKDLSVPGGQRIAVSAVAVHPKRNSSASTYDFALLRLAQKADAAPIDRFYRGKIQGGKTLFVGGWGETEYQTLPSQMQEVRVRSYSNNYCASRYGAKAAVFCAGRVGGDYDACFGDSGGPIVSRSGSRETLWGLVSFGVGCGLAKWPGAYAKVSSALPWIRKTTSSHIKQRFRPPGQEEFPLESEVHLGPLKSFSVQRWTRDEYPATPNLFSFRLTERRDWPVSRVDIVAPGAGNACSQHACNQLSWQMEEYEDNEWFLYLYTENPCPQIATTVYLRNSKRFILHKRFCQ